MAEPDLLLTESGAVIKFSGFSSYPGTRMLCYDASGRFY